MNRIARLGLAIALLTTSSGCVTVRPPTFLRPLPERKWPSTLAVAEARVSEGRYTVADSVLAQFAARYPDSPEAFESEYWRALFSMDPKNPHESVPAAVSLLDTYLTGLYPRKHRREAFALRAIAGQIADNRNALGAAQTREVPLAQPGAVRIDVPKPTADPAADAEIKRLKDELAKANAELERIRKRLAQPPATKP